MAGTSACTRSGVNPFLFSTSALSATKYGRCASSTLPSPTGPWPGATIAAPSLLRLGERVDPGAAVAVAHEVERAVDRRIAREQDLFLRQPREAVAVRVPDAEVPQLDAMLPVVEDHDVPVEQ